LISVFYRIRLKGVSIMGSLSIWHWLIVLAIVSLVFGTKKIRTLGTDLGGAIKGFKQSMQEVELASTTQAGTKPVVDAIDAHAGSTASH